MSRPQLLKSPCQQHCHLDGNDICLGCFRHIDEITSWQGYSIEKKQDVIRVSRQRKEKAK